MSTWALKSVFDILVCFQPCQKVVHMAKTTTKMMGSYVPLVNKYIFAKITDQKFTIWPIWDYKPETLINGEHIGKMGNDRNVIIACYGT